MDTEPSNFILLCTTFTALEFRQTFSEMGVTEGLLHFGHENAAQFYQLSGESLVVVTVMKVIKCNSQ